MTPSFTSESEKSLDYRKNPLILTLNAGSSSLKFAIFSQSPSELVRISYGQWERLNLKDPRLNWYDFHQNKHDSIPFPIEKNVSPAEICISWLAQKLSASTLLAIGHRVVHGGDRFYSPTLVDETVLQSLEQLIPLAPDHLPAELELIQSCKKSFPGTKQIACFDTAFHHTLPSYARTLSLPRRFAEQGIHRFGFHGLSYSYLQSVLNKEFPGIAQKKIIMAHLGNGCSMCALEQGRSIDTTMSFTPCAGVPMGSRSGDIDPGLLRYFHEHLQLSTAQMNEIFLHQSGLKGVSGLSSDIRDLLAQKELPQVRETLDWFAYQLRKAIGALTAALGGLDALVFSGGMGEHCAWLRQAIIQPLAYLGLVLDTKKNEENATVISPDPTSKFAPSPIPILVIPTNEEKQIAEESVLVAQK